MAVQLVLRKGTDAENDSFTGADAEVTVDVTNKTLRVHDGTTAGGFQTASLAGAQTLTNKTLSSPEFTGQITGDLIPSDDVTYNLGSASNRWNDLFLSGSTINLGGATISAIDGSFEFKDAGGNASSVSLDANTTDDLAEGSTNLYAAQPVDTTDNVTFNNITANGDITVDGDLIVNGTSTTLNTTTLDVEDINITVANGADDATAADGAGLTIDLGTDGTADFTYDSANDRLESNKSIAADLIGDVTGTVSDIANHTTDDLGEGSTNLYYTDTRARNAVSAGTGLDYSSATGEFSLADTTVTAGSFGSASEVPVITVDAQGRITDASTTNVAGVSSFSYDAATGDLDIGTADGSTFTATVALSGGSGIDFSASTISHSDTSTQSSVNNSDGTVIQDVDVDDFGHITSLGSIDLDGRYYTESEADGLFVDVSGDTMTGFLTLNDDPTDNLHAATKRYVDDVAQGLKTRPAVDALSDSNLDATYDNGTDGVGATLTANNDGSFPDTDGVTLDSVGDRILVTAQNDAAHNGLYVLTVVGDSSTPWELTRCDSCNESVEIPGSFVFVQSGTEYNATGWVAEVDDRDTFTIGTDDIDWIQFSGAGVFTAGSGLDLNGDVFSHTDTSSVSDVSATSNTFVDALTFDDFGHVTAVSTSTAAPPNDATITISAGDGLSTGGSFTTDQDTNATITIDHADTSTQSSVDNSGNTVIQDITLDGFGHITGLSSKTIDPPTLDTLGLDTDDDVRFDSLGIGTNATGVSGEIVATGDITANASDDRLKDRLGVIQDAVDKVNTLSGFYFEFNDTAIDLGLQEGKRVGVSAQEVQGVLPEVVKDSPVDNEYLTVQYEKLVPLLIEAIKEQSSTIDDLKTRINNLEDQSHSH